jgi:hypothetical protein
MRHRRFISVASLWLLAGVQHAWIAPYLALLPSDYAESFTFIGSNRTRETPDGAWVEGKTRCTRRDQTLVSSSTHNIVQGIAQFFNTDGTLNYEIGGIYGVDRHTRKNLPGYGDVDRHGFYMAPQQMAPSTYTLWDPLNPEPRQLVFEKLVEIQGVMTHEYRFMVKNPDETKNLREYPDVPNRYGVQAETAGSIWIEPVSGRFVDYIEGGKASFTDKATGERIADFILWDNRYTEETRAAQLELARKARIRILALENWLPIGLLTAGALLLFSGRFGPSFLSGFWLRRRPGVVR